MLAEENIEDYIAVPAEAGGADGEYVLRVRGDSMIDAGMLEGDYVVVRPAKDATNGEIVVALVGEEATVKRFYREADHIRLQPENSTMEPIRSKEAVVLGRVVGLFRSLNDPGDASARPRLGAQPAASAAGGPGAHTSCGARAAATDAVRARPARTGGREADA